MTSKIDLSKLKKAEKIALCKERNLKKYSGLTNKELDLMLIKDGVEDISVEQLAKNPKSPPKPRVDKIDKKLEKSIAIGNYADALMKLDSDVSDEDLYLLVKDEVEAFITSGDLTIEDHIKYVNSYISKRGVGSLLEAYNKGKNTCIKGMKAKGIDYALSAFIYSNDDTVANLLIKKLRRQITILNKPKKESVKKESSKDSKNDSEEEPESDDE
jgi:hypothetical protein